MGWSGYNQRLMCRGDSSRKCGSSSPATQVCFDGAATGAVTAGVKAQVKADCAVSSNGCEWHPTDDGLSHECIYATHCDSYLISCVATHKSMASNIFIWCQIFNEINARKVNGELN